MTTKGSYGLDIGAIHAGIRVGRGEGGQVEAQSLDGRFERAELSGTTFNLVEKEIGLCAEVRVSVCRWRIVPDPIGVADATYAPTPVVKFDFHASEGGVELKGGFVGRLILVKGVADENVTATGDDIHGVLDRNIRKDLM